MNNSPDASIDPLQYQRLSARTGGHLLDLRLSASHGRRPGNRVLQLRSQSIQFDVVQGPAADKVLAAVKGNPGFKSGGQEPQDEALLRLRTNRTLVVVAGSEAGEYQYYFDPSNPEAKSARIAIDDVLQRAAGRKDPVKSAEVKVEAPALAMSIFWFPVSSA